MPLTLALSPQAGRPDAALVLRFVGLAIMPRPRAARDYRAGPRHCGQPAHLQPGTTSAADGGARDDQRRRRTHPSYWLHLSEPWRTTCLGSWSLDFPTAASSTRQQEQIIPAGSRAASFPWRVRRSLWASGSEHARRDQRGAADAGAAVHGNGLVDAGGRPPHPPPLRRPRRRARNGYDVDAAFATIGTARGVEVPDTEAQRAWVGTLVASHARPEHVGWVRAEGP
jgi:hypothetical protein